MSSPNATAPVRTDWSLIWAERGFRYFFFAMFISGFIVAGSALAHQFSAALRLLAPCQAGASTPIVDNLIPVRVLSLATAT
jgi:hypothetical protein